jgi:hypothetical protein
MENLVLKELEKKEGKNKEKIKKKSKANKPTCIISCRRNPKSQPV